MAEQLPILLPCPFCGVVPVIERCADTFDYLTGPRKWWGICCRSTLNLGGSCAVEIRPQASIEAAAKRWNTRAPAQSALDEANAIIEQRNAMCSAYFAEVAELRREVEALRADAKWDIRWFKINRRRVGKSAQSEDLMRYPILADAERALPLFRADYPNWQVDIFEVAQRRIDTARASTDEGVGK